MWNPDRDHEALLKEFCKKFYGPAAAPMERYYQALEKAWNRQKNVYDFRVDYDNSGFQVYTPGDMETLVKCVREAEKLGYETCIVPKLHSARKTEGKPLKIKLVEVGNIRELASLI